MILVYNNGCSFTLRNSHTDISSLISLTMVHKHKLHITVHLFYDDITLV